MSARDDYPKLDRTAKGSSWSSTEAQAALTEVDFLRAKVDRLGDVLSRANWSHDLAKITPGTSPHVLEMLAWITAPVRDYEAETDRFMEAIEGTDQHANGEGEHAHPTDEDKAILARFKSLSIGTPADHDCTPGNPWDDGWFTARSNLLRFIGGES